MGKVLGMGRSHKPNAIMYSFLKHNHRGMKSTEDFDLYKDDVDGIQVGIIKNGRKRNFTTGIL